MPVLYENSSSAILDLFAVVLESYESPPAEKLAALLQAVSGLPKLDAKQRAARARGIVVERLSRQQADQFRLVLGNWNFPSRVLPQASVPPAVKGRRVHLVVPIQGGFHVRWSPTGPLQAYCWTDLLVISAGVVFHHATEQVLKTVLQTGLLGSGRFAPQTRTEVAQRDASKHIAMAAITLGRPPQQMETLRLRAPEMEYETILGKENLRPSSLENFCLLLARIGNLANDAYITPETVELIAAANASPRLPKSPRFESEDDFDHYQRWLITLRTSP